MSLHMLQLGLAYRPLLAWARQTKIPARDVGYLAHAALRALFGVLAPQPFALLGDPVDHASSAPPFLNLLGYGTATARELEDVARALAEPLLFSALAGGILGKPMPDAWPGGRRFGFTVRVCPVRRHRNDGNKIVERDAFLSACVAAPEAAVDRQAVYREWLVQQLEQHGAAKVVGVKMTSFHLARPARRNGGKQAVGMGDRPDVRLEGTLETGDSEAFSALLARGVGRHRAFGYGMLLLRATRS